MKLLLNNLLFGLEQFKPEDYIDNIQTIELNNVRDVSATTDQFKDKILIFKGLWKNLDTDYNTCKLPYNYFYGFYHK